MSILGNQPSFSQPSPKSMRCPYLGLQDDPETALGYPSVWNSCHRVKPVVPPSSEHQQEVCLTFKYDDCPAFNSDRIRALPKDLRMPEIRRPRHIIARWTLIGLVLIFILASSLILTGYWNTPSLERLLFLAQTDSVTLTVPVTEAFTQVEEMVMSQESTLENETPSPTTDTIPLTQTQAVLEKICAYSLEMPIGVSSQLLLHKVKGGESMAMLAENYETTEETIDIVNYFMPSPLWAELIIVIPVGTTEISDISSLKP
ncbi:MAG: hypothetical protein GY751_09625, partial [Bacteroidetes bacterium]|nr:hypothetical protein [Bacteroidota bacterium]